MEFATASRRRLALLTSSGSAATAIVSGKYLEGYLFLHASSAGALCLIFFGAPGVRPHIFTRPHKPQAADTRQESAACNTVVYLIWRSLERRWKQIQQPTITALAADQASCPLILISFYRATYSEIRGDFPRPISFQNS